MNEEYLRQLFKNRSDCYADADDVIQAMTESRFIEILKELDQIILTENEIDEDMIKVIYRNEDSVGVHEIEVDKLNEFEGVDFKHLQVLKSAAGFFIGALCKADWHPTFWEPNFRDSQGYWDTRTEAEDALRSGDYPVKF